MGIFDFFGNSEAAYDKKKEVEGWIKSYQHDLLVDNFAENKEVFDEIFDLSMTMLQSIPPKNILKEANKHVITADAIALNIIQNSSMTMAMDSNAKDLFFGGFNRYNISCELYKRINQIKLEKSYISQIQYDQNEGLLFKIQMERM